MQLLGRNFDKFGEVMHAEAFVFKEIFLYLLEFKKVKSFSFALGKDSIPLISKSLIFEL